MDENYIDSLTKEQRAAWGVQIFIRLWLSGMCQSQAAQNWTIAQIAILFEVTQAHLFREESHTATSLSKELNLPIQTVSRTVRDLQKMGLVAQQEAKSTCTPPMTISHETRWRSLLKTLAGSGITVGRLWTKPTAPLGTFQ
jgi:2C-methyl-D-erythritol 2,4-cyclodiphosphate synthase